MKGIRLNVIMPTLVLSGSIDNTWTIDLAKLFIKSKFCAPTLLDMSRTNTISARVPLQSKTDNLQRNYRKVKTNEIKF